MHTIERICHDKATAYQAATESYEMAKLLVQDGKRAKFSLTEAGDERSIQQNRYYWGVVLKEIAEQARLDGTRYTAEAWHIHCKRTFLGYRFKKVQLPGKKRKSVIKELRSTADLAVRPFSQYIEKVMAFAITDLGVRFSAPDWREWQG